MDFIFIQGLWFLPIVSIPIIINIFNNRKFKVLNFSTVRFLESLKSDSIKKINLLNLILLLLRMLIILFLILAISRPTINSKSNALNNDASTRVVILVDDSYSTLNEYTYAEQTKKIGNIINKITSEYKSSANIDVATINNGLLFSGVVKNLNVNKIIIKPTYKNGNMWNLMSSYFKDDRSSNYVNLDMYIISDMDESSFSGIEKELSWDIGFINIIPKNKKPAISNIFASKNIIFPNDQFDVTLTIINDSDIDYTQNDDLLTAYLHIGKDSSVPQKFDIEPNSTKNIIFKGISSLESSMISASLSLNDEPSGHKKYLSSNVLTNIDIGLSNLLNEETKSFISKATESIKKNRFTMAETDLASNLRQYDVLIIDNIVHLQKYDIVEYLNNGGHIVVFQSQSNNNISEFIKIDGKQIVVKYELDNYQIKKEDVLDVNFRQDVFNPSKDNVLFELSGFHSVPLNSNTIIKTNNRSIWNRYYVNNGLVDYLGFNLSVENTDFAISPSFIPFIYNLIISNIKKESNVVIQKSLSAFLNVQKQDFPLTLLRDSVEIDNFDFFDNKINLSKIDEPGYYGLLSKKNKGRKVRSYLANIDKNEIQYKEANFNSFLSLFNENSFKYDYQTEDLNNFENIISGRVNGTELWHFCILISVLLFILESLIISFYHRRI